MVAFFLSFLIGYYKAREWLDAVGPGLMLLTLL